MTPRDVDELHPDELRAFRRFMVEQLKAEKLAAERAVRRRR